MDCSPKDVIIFPGGIPPFAESTRFVLMSDEKKQPLLFLQSADDESLCFITIPVRVVDSGYRFAVERQDLLSIRWEQDRQPSFDDLVCLAILTVPENGPVTANLLAPVLIHTATRLGVQTVRADGLYTHCHAWIDGHSQAAPPC